MPKPSLSVKHSDLVVKFSNKALLLRFKVHGGQSACRTFCVPCIALASILCTWLTFSTEISKYAPSKVCLVFVTMQ